MDSRITLTHGCSLSNLPLFVAEAAGLFEAEGLDVEVPRFTTLSSTSDIIASGTSDLGTVAFTEPLIDASPIGMLDHAVRHCPDHDRADLEAGARRQPPASTSVTWNTRFAIAGIRSSRWGSSLETTSRRPIWLRSTCWRSSWSTRAVQARIHPETKHQRRSQP